MSNNLALNPMVNYRMNSLEKIVPYPWKVAVLIASEKTVNVRNFYDNGGGYVQQSNDTVRQFHLNVSDLKLQNADTTTAHLYTLLARIFEKKQMIRGGTMWDQTYGCANQYRCYIAYFMMYFLSKSYRIVLHRYVDTPGHGKYVVHGFNGFQKQ